LSQRFVDISHVTARTAGTRRARVRPGVPGRSSAAGRRRAGRSVPIPERTVQAVTETVDNENLIELCTIIYTHSLFKRIKSKNPNSASIRLRRGVDLILPFWHYCHTASIYARLLVYNLNCNLSAGSVAPCKNFGGLVIHAKKLAKTIHFHVRMKLVSP
jgi:hypothetical protein